LVLFIKRIARSLVSRDGRADLRFEWRRRLLGEPSLPSRDPTSILVLCHGNLCRSPFAERLLAQRLPGLRVSSAGIHAATGHSADPTAIRVASEYGVDLGSHRTRPLERDEAASADLILGFQGHHTAEVVRRWPNLRARTSLLGDFLPDSPYVIGDPWNQGDDAFRSAYTRIEVAVMCLKARLTESAG
jgi:protein-tyrosine phosphatase